MFNVTLFYAGHEGRSGSRRVEITEGCICIYTRALYVEKGTFIFLSYCCKAEMCNERLLLVQFSFGDGPQIVALQMSSCECVSCRKGL